MAVPRLPGFLVPLHFSEICGEPASRDALEALLRTLDWRGVVQVVSSVTAASWQSGIEDRRHQVPFVRSFVPFLLFGESLERRLVLEPHRPVFTRESLLALLRIAVALQSEAQPSHREFANTFVRAALMANELLGNEILPETPEGSAADLVRSELRSEVMHLDNPHDLLARTEAFIAWAGAPAGLGSAYSLPVEEDFLRFTGLTWREYAAGA